MKVFRIAKCYFIDDLTGKGAELYGGRWNKKGIPLIYTSESRSLASLEFLVHTAMSSIPLNLCVATIEIAGKPQITEINEKELPLNWKEYPAPLDVINLGTSWILSKQSLLLRVPSVIVKDEFNYLINPLHGDINKVTVKTRTNYSFDIRLLKKMKGEHE
ncbi:MAG: RES domain-containing protein [Bacteroidetes bacterium]|nr:RES domain-containing protein [Bacteroidota bacterium]